LISRLPLLLPGLNAATVIVSRRVDFFHDVFAKGKMAYDRRQRLDYNSAPTA
jgi:hypothetical protein